MTETWPRTLLFVPGHRESMVAKATSRNADAIVFDFEDSVPLAEKAAARRTVAGELAGRDDQSGPQLYIRINAPSFDMLDDDLAVVADHPNIGIIIPKVDRPAELAGVFDRIGQGERDVIINIETPRSILRAEAFADTPGVGGLVLGGEDLTLLLGMRRTDSSDELTIPRFMLLAACRAAGIAAYDVVCPEFRNLDIVEQDARTAAAMGYDGKFAIHPAQIDPILRAFTPNAEELAQAQGIVDAYDQAVAEGRGAVEVDGQMIDPPVAERARAIVNRARSR